MPENTTGKKTLKKKARVSWTSKSMQDSPHQKLAELGGLPPSEYDQHNDVEVMSEAPEIDTTVAHSYPRCHESRCMRQCAMYFAFLCIVIVVCAILIAVSFIADDPRVLCDAAKSASAIINVTDTLESLQCSLSHNLSTDHRQE
jgi:hypothetical protein